MLSDQRRECDLIYNFLKYTFTVYISNTLQSHFIIKVRMTQGRPVKVLLVGLAWLLCFVRDGSCVAQGYVGDITPVCQGLYSSMAILF